MNLTALRSKDFWAGLMLIATGGAAILLARDYAFGTTTRMGPGYFPTLLGALLILFGLYLVVAGLRDDTEEGKIEPGWSPRALIVLPLSLVLFGVLMDRAGFIPALAVLIFGSAAAGTDFRPLEILLLTVALTAFSVVVFVWGIGLPYPLLVGF
jgi:Tripartite tricarboxylate transporter TctB family